MASKATPNYSGVRTYRVCLRLVASAYPRFSCHITCLPYFGLKLSFVNFFHPKVNLMWQLYVANTKVTYSYPKWPTVTQSDPKVSFPIIKSIPPSIFAVAWQCLSTSGSFCLLPHSQPMLNLASLLSRGLLPP